MFCTHSLARHSALFVANFVRVVGVQHVATDIAVGEITDGIALISRVLVHGSYTAAFFQFCVHAAVLEA